MPRRLSILVLLALSIVVLVMPSSAAGGGCHPNLDVEMTTSSDHLVGIGECAFIDTVVHIEPGERVTWVNKDPVPHTVSGAAYSWGTERLLEEGQRVSYRFESEGVYPYYCALHPAMVGAVVVGDATKAAAVTNGTADVAADDGSEAAELGATATEKSFPAPVVALAVIATLGLAVVAARVLGVRRRAASATLVR